MEYPYANRKVIKFCVDAITGQPSNIEVLSVFEEQLKRIGVWMKQAHPEVLEEMIRYFSLAGEINQKTKRALIDLV